MRLTRSWICLLLIASFAAEAAVVYKWTDADGVVHYSDQPFPGAEQIITSGKSLNGYSAPRNAPPASGPNGSQFAQAVPITTAFTIDSPTKEQVFFADDVIPVRLHLLPELTGQRSLTWRLNGAALDEHANSLGFALQSLPRGTYALTATVTDQQTHESKTSEPVTFYVRQPSDLAPLHKRS